MFSHGPWNRVFRIASEAALGLFLLGLLLIILLPPRSRAGGPEAERANVLLPAQGTPIAATITGSIDGAEPVFTGQRHFRSGLIGDRTCQLFGVNGSRFYDEVAFFNSSPITQKVIISFSPSCATNTFMAAYDQQFNPANICDNYIASSGVSGPVVWEFNVCANSQFSIVVYGLKPGLTCVGYSYTVFGEGIMLTGPAVKGAAAAPPVKVQVAEPGAFPPSDVTIRKRKRKLPGTDVFFKRIIPPGVTSALPAGGTPLVASVSDSISGAEPSFTGSRHFFTGVPGEGNCLTIPPVATRFYDEYFFFNNSKMSQTISVSFNPTCGNAFMAAYDTQFNPANICDNFIASAGRFGAVNWEFTVCPNSMFSIVVYNPFTEALCFNYTFQVFGNEISFLGTVADLAISKSASPSMASAGSDITYTITVSNNGPNPATDVMISDPLPAGTTFVSLISNLGTALICSTPPPGGSGTVSCLLPLLGTPASGSGSATFSIIVNVGPSAPSVIANTATVSRLGIDPNLSNNSATAVVTMFDACLQDESNGNILQIDTATGVYQFTNCNGITISGTGMLTVKGCTLTLQHNAPDRRVLARIDTCVNKGTASLQDFARGATFTISDRDISNNACACQ